MLVGRQVWGEGGLVHSKQPRRKRQMARPVKLLQAAVIMRMEPQAILVVVLVGCIGGLV